MQKSSELLMCVLLIAVSWGYLSLSQAQNTPKEAALADTSVILSDMESELKTVETPSGKIPAGTNLYQLLTHSPHIALIGKSSDPPLMPDISGTHLGGCPVNDQNWTALRYDYAALTQIPTTWDDPHIKLCLDRNGPAGPNLPGYDVIWLQLSRTGSPHVTLIPSKDS